MRLDAGDSEHGAFMKKVGVGFWPGLKPGESDHWYIAWFPDEPYSSGLREPTEAEVKEAVRIINAHFGEES